MAEIKIIGLLDVKREQDQRVYEGGGIAPCLRAENSEVKILTEVKIIGQMDNTLDNTFESANRVYDKNGLCPTIPTCAGGGIQPKIIDKYIVAMRGRNPEHPTDRTPGIHTEQRLEMNKDGLANTLTTVQKDNLLLEAKTIRMVRTEEGKALRKAYENHEVTHGFNEYRKAECREDGLVNTLSTVQKDNLLFEKKIQKVGQISSDGSEYGTVISENGLSSTLAARTHGYCNNCIQQAYRIRKLTPKECWRLMGYTDRDFEKAAEVNSNTQLYKQAGNAIVKQVLMAIFEKMIK